MVTLGIEALRLSEMLVTLLGDVA